MKLADLQKKRMDQARDRAMVEARAAVRGQFDPSRIAWDDPDFSVKRLRESVAQSSFPALLRAGVQNFLFDGYQDVPTIYQSLVRAVSSNKYEELYAPLYGTEVPEEILPGDPFPDSRLVGQDEHVRNKKFGRMLTVERELVDDDMTGQIQMKASGLGEKMAYREEMTALAAIVSGGTIGYSTAIGNLNPTPGLITQSGIEAADVALEEMVDPLGNFLLVMPDTLLVSPSDKFDTAKLLNSTLQPSVPGAAGLTAGTAASGGTGWTMTTNPLQGLYAIKSSRFLPGAPKGLDATNGSWFLMQAAKGVVWQDRDPLEVMQENTMSGQSFETDDYRWRVRRRFNAATIEPRFTYRGN